MRLAVSTMLAALMAALVGCDSKDGGDPKMRAGDSGQEVEPAISGRDYILQKLDSIVIPSANFEDTTVEDAVEFVRMRMAELDPDPDFSTKGVSFVIRVPAVSGCGGFPSPGDLLEDKLSLEEDQPKRITLREKNIKAIDLLTICAEQAGLNFYLTSRGFVMIPETERLNPENERKEGVEIWKVIRQTKDQGPRTKN